MIDMHIHSTNSDGTKTVIEILKEAQGLGLNTISFTDHETCNAYDELEKIDINEFYTGKIETGIELKSQYKEMVMDILGYGINCDKMKEHLAECYKNTSREEIQEKQLEEFYKAALEINLTLRPIEKLEWDKKRDWASKVFYKELKSHEENKEKLPEDLWESFLNFRKNYYHVKGNLFHTNRSKYYPKIEEIIDIIHKSGGKAFIAHLFEYEEIENKMLELEEIVNKYDIDGIECYHSIFMPEESKELLEFAEKHNLLICGGSDYHGDNKPDIKLGVGKGNLEIPDNIIENWFTEDKHYC